MKNSEIAALCKDIAPIIKQYVRQETEPIRRRLDDIEAERRKTLPRFRVKALSREITA